MFISLFTAFIGIKALGGIPNLHPYLPQTHLSQKVVANADEFLSLDPAFSPIVMLQKVSENGRSNCTGTLIRPNVILTAAHCVVESRAEQGKVIGIAVFDYGRYSPIVAHSIAVVPHPRYQPEKQMFGLGGQASYNDLALVLINRSLTNKGVLPLAKQPSHKLQGPALVAGYGRTSGDNVHSAGILRIGRVEHIELNRDREDLPEQFILRGSSTQACSGDSGGPVMKRFGLDYHIVSVNSWGAKSCQFNSRSEAIYQHLAWIQRTLAAWR